VTDHRAGVTLHQLDRVMEGEIDELIDAVATHLEAEALKENPA
jgi:peptide chain release factor 1